MKRVLLVSAGVLALVGAAVPVATAQTPEKGEGLGSFSLSANAPAVQVQVDGDIRCGRSATAPVGCEGVVPMTSSNLSNGPVGYGLSAVVWPGTLGGNLGSTVIVSGGPPEASSLNSPVRAEARTGGGGDEVVNDDTPGARMTAQATDDEVKAAASLASSQAVAVGTFGNTRSSSRSALTGVASAVAEATSSVSDIELAGGLVTIEGVRSTARATTDGTLAKVEGSTVASGIEIAGVPVSISDKGITVQGTSTPVNKTLTDTVNAAIEQAGMTIALSTPLSTVERGSGQYRAASLVFVWNPTPEQQITAVLGGAAAQVAAEPALTFDLGGVDVPTTPGDVPVTDPGFTGGTPGIPGTPGVPGSDAVALDPVAAAPDLAAPVAGAPATDPVLAEPVLAAERRALPEGIPLASVVLGLVGAGLLAAGFRRLPDRLLAETPTSRCALEGAP